MFETLETATESAADLLRRAADTHAEHKRTGCQKLVVAAAWADVHSWVSGRDAGLDVAGERLVAIGPAGCPEVAESAPAELALAFQTSIAGARGLIRDALNLRHRLPRVWARVLAGDLHDWKARQIAQRTAHLHPLQAPEVDRLIVNHIELVAWRRFEKVLDATLLHVDERTYRDRADQSRNHRDVWATESGAGLRTLVARADAGDITVFIALVDRIAEALAEEGDEDPAAVRRAKAIGIAGYPDRTLDLLLRHRHDEDPRLQPWQRSSSVDPDTVGGRDSSLANPIDPWDPGPPPAGWQNAEYANYHQPRLDDPDFTASQRAGAEDREADETVPDPDDLAWYLAHTTASAAPVPTAAPERAADRADGAPSPARYANTGGINLVNALAAFSGLDAGALDRARPQVVIDLHLTDAAVTGGPTARGVIRTDHGPITTEQLRRFLGDTGGAITIKPVFDPAAVAPVDAYEIPLKQRRAIAVRNPGSVFPFSPSTFSARTRLDLDHTQRYRSGGPPGQTRLGNLGPCARSEHRAKTHARWSTRQPEPGTHLWRSPQHWIALVTNQATILLGDSPFAQRIWRAAEPDEPVLLQAV